MWSKNKAAMTKAERDHVERVKLLPCSVCGDGGGEHSPSAAHEIKQGQWFTSVALCWSCHQGPLLGLHGEKRTWRLFKMDEIDALNETLRRLLA